MVRRSNALDARGGPPTHALQDHEALGIWCGFDPQCRVRGKVLVSGLVEHVRADVIHYRPSERVTGWSATSPTGPAGSRP
jgi:hypothetical protein